MLMPSTTRNATDDLQAQVLDSIRKTQEAVVDGLRSWTEAAGQFVPGTGAWPGAERVPTPAELIDAAYDFAGEVLKAQREFLHQAIQVTAPLSDRAEQHDGKTAGHGKS
jgi:hypothetical protein